MSDFTIIDNDPLKNAVIIGKETYSSSKTNSMSEDIRAFGAAFWEAKKHFKPTGQSGRNRNQNYDYAKIGDIYNGIESALWEQKIVIWHFSWVLNGVEYLSTRLTHFPTGQFIEDVRMSESEKPGNQGKGAANTYMRKQALQSLCAIPCEDDDCEEEQEHMATKPSNLNQDPISDEQALTLLNLINASPNSKIVLSNILKFNKIKNIAELPARSFESVKVYIEKIK
jgi:hypothetical protein